VLEGESPRVCARASLCLSDGVISFVYPCSLPIRTFILRRLRRYHVLYHVLIYLYHECKVSEILYNIYSSETSGIGA
jgi:hypothetical protein